MASIDTNQWKNEHLGYFTNIEEAKTVRQQASKLYFGEYLNECEKL